MDILEYEKYLTMNIIGIDGSNKVQNSFWISVQRCLSLEARLALKPDRPRGQKFGLGLGLVLELASASKLSCLSLEILASFNISISVSGQMAESRLSDLLIWLFGCLSFIGKEVVKSTWGMRNFVKEIYCETIKGLGLAVGRFCAKRISHCQGQTYKQMTGPEASRRGHSTY